MGHVSLIVMEQGGAWPGRVGDSENVVAAHGDKETLLPRTLQKLESLRRRGQHLRIAVLACNAETDGASVARRAEVARELLRAVAAVGFGRLLLSTANGASLQLRHELLGLANALRQTLAGPAATVTVRFGDLESAREPARIAPAAKAEPRTAGVAGPRYQATGPCETITRLAES